VIGLVADPEAMKTLVEKPAGACWTSVKTELGKVTLAYQILASRFLQHVHTHTHTHVMYTYTHTYTYTCTSCILTLACQTLAYKVTAGSQLGAKLFGKAMDMVTSDSVRESIVNLIKKLSKTKITQQDVDAIMVQMTEVTKNMSMKALSQKRSVVLTYRGLEITMSVTNVMEET
jgi:hypothetical protein